jgi:hypothetical protein
MRAVGWCRTEVLLVQFAAELHFLQHGNTTTLYDALTPLPWPCFVFNFWYGANYLEPTIQHRRGNALTDAVPFPYLTLPSLTSSHLTFFYFPTLTLTVMRVKVGRACLVGTIWELS